MGRAEDPQTISGWAKFVMPHGVLKMESSKDLAHTPRHLEVVYHTSTLYVIALVVTLDPSVPI